MLTAFGRPGRFFKGNLHGHSTGSDGVKSPADACAAYREKGYDFTVLSDHFLDEFGFQITDTRPFRTETFTTIIGAELHVPNTSRGELWHILAVGLPFDFAKPSDGETGPQLARRARKAGAFVALAHPHWYQLQLEDGRTLDAAHAVEVYNHTSQVHCDAGDGLVMLDALLSAGQRRLAIAVDDSHWMDGDAFGGWVMVKAEANTPEALLSALRNGAFYASQGPEIHDIRREGNDLVIACSPAKTIMLNGPGMRHAYAHAGTEGGHLNEARLDLTPFLGSWCRLAVADAEGRRAWSNPLWLD